MSCRHHLKTGRVISWLPFTQSCARVVLTLRHYLSAAAVLARTDLIAVLPATYNAPRVSLAGESPMTTRTWVSFHLLLAAAFTIQAAEPSRAFPEPTVSGHRAGAIFRDCTEVCPEMVVIPPGRFMMGAPSTEPYDGEDEGPVHEVHIRYAFAVSQHPITRAEWKRFVRETGHHDRSACLKGQQDNHPVVCVDWQDATDYAAWLSINTGKHYRLLSEAEWEYAARAGTTTAYYWGREIGSGHAACDGCESTYDSKSTAPVETFPPNKFGLYDMAGNAFSWTQDCYHHSYNGAPSNGSAWRSGSGCSAGHVVRGGAWLTGPLKLRCAYRAGYDDDRDGLVGFRLARTAD
jgi:formylglycine-generating enzyme required for sulfatase activity